MPRAGRYVVYDPDDGWYAEASRDVAEWWYDYGIFAAGVVVNGTPKEHR